MHEIKMFKCPLFPDDASFTEADLQKRVSHVLNEVYTLLDQVKNNKVFEVIYKYNNEENFFWLVFFAKSSAQLQLKLSKNEETVVEFVLRVQKQIKSLPLILNFVALELESSLVNSMLEVDSKNKDLTAFMIKNSGKERIFQVENRNQHILFPEQTRFRVDTAPREINCRVCSLGKYEVLVDCIEDKLYSLKRSIKLRIALGSSGTEKKRFFEIAEYLYTGSQARFEVNAIIDIVTNSVVEYQFIGEN